MCGTPSLGNIAYTGSCHHMNQPWSFSVCGSCSQAILFACLTSLRIMTQSPPGDQQQYDKDHLIACQLPCACWYLHKKCCCNFSNCCCQKLLCHAALLEELESFVEQLDQQEAAKQQALRRAEAAEKELKAVQAQMSKSVSN